MCQGTGPGYHSQSNWSGWVGGWLGGWFILNKSSSDSDSYSDCNFLEWFASVCGWYSARIWQDGYQELPSVSTPSPSSRLTLTLGRENSHSGGEEALKVKRLKGTKSALNWPGTDAFISLLTRHPFASPLPFISWKLFNWNDRLPDSSRHSQSKTL